MTKTPDEIKKGLENEIAVHYHLPNPEPRLTPREFMYMEQLHKDALYYICQLECRLAKVYAANERALKYLEKLRNQLTEANQQKSCLESRLAHAQRERDAAVADMRTAFRKCNVCFSCKYDDGESNECMDCRGSCNWQWRGVCEENSKEEQQ